jgi:hypothetical protein
MLEWIETQEINLTFWDELRLLLKDLRGHL